MKILAVYGSHFGQAEKVLRRIVAALEGAGHTVEVFKGDAVPSGTAVTDYEAVLVAASIQMGQYQGYMRDFARRNVAALSDRPSAFVSVNGSHPESEPEWQAEARGYVAQFVEQTGWQPRWTATFTGALRYKSYNPLLRWFMKRIVAKGGGPTDTSQDYEFTDWDHVDRFAAELVAALAGLPPAPAIGGESGGRHEVRGDPR